jgi:hypothetical protein
VVEGNPVTGGSGVGWLGSRVDVMIDGEVERPGLADGKSLA